jgi:NAD dependent epimerase/dehydratase family enzyme
LGSLAYFGKGDQYFSWIHIDDLCGIFIKSIEDDSMTGTYNGVAPDPVTYKTFAKNLQKVLGGLRIAHSVPKFALKILLGERAILLLGSARVVPNRLLECGYKFRFTDLKVALKDLLGKGI